MEDYKLLIEFSDGTKGIADLSSHVKQEPFIPLQDINLFTSAFLDHGAVKWPKNIGITTEALYRLVKISNIIEKN